MKVAILGYGIDGKSALPHWLAKGDDVTICDQKDVSDVLPPEVKGRFGNDHMKGLDEFDVIVRSSGIRPQTILDANPEHPEIAGRITSGMAEFLALCPTKNLIGITGTKGKGTTSTLVTNILKACGKTVHLCGNIGIAALQLLPQVQPDDFVVLELSSFQLTDSHARIPTAACLMIAPEHLNWHADMDDYLNAKAQLFVHQQPEDRVIFNIRSRYSREITDRSPAHQHIPYDVPPEGMEPGTTEGAYVKDTTIYYQGTAVMPAADVQLPGRHNLENVCAAIAIVWPFVQGNLDAIRQGVISFGGLPHHTEYITTINDVAYYNDSYSTMPDATIAALNAIPGKKVLILGGGSKNLPLDHLMDAVAAADLRHILLMGSLAEQLRDMLQARGVTNFSMTRNGMAEIVKDAQKYAQPGDVVLLSPGLPAKGDGFFIDNVDRGNQFKACLGATPSDHH